ncbi:DNA repair protein complementing XP-A cells [Cherax quadricarinatus]
MAAQQKRSIFDNSDEEDMPCDDKKKSKTKPSREKIYDSAEKHSSERIIQSSSLDAAPEAHCSNTIKESESNKTEKDEDMPCDDRKKSKTKPSREKIYGSAEKHSSERIIQSSSLDAAPEAHCSSTIEESESNKTENDVELEKKTNEKVSLTAAQRALIEQKRQQALLIRREKLNRRNPYVHEEKKKDSEKVIRINNTKLIDTGGGFFIEETDGISNDDMLTAMKLVTDPAPLFEEDRPHCLDCDHPFDSSFLFKNFDHPTCDQCRDKDDKHCLITKTDARNEYLLKDVDFEKRKPPLKFIVRKNPHNSRWGDMKLYLKLQVEKRALEVWGSEEALEEALEKKDHQKEANKQKRYNKKMKELRMSVRSSLYTRVTKIHEHEYGEEVYLPDEDEYSRTCTTCGHSYTYDKL